MGESDGRDGLRNAMADAPRAASTGPAMSSRSAWAGSWPGDIAGTPATLTLRESGGRVTGDIDAQGYRYTIDAASEAGGIARGRLVDSQTGATMDLRMSLVEGGVTVDLSSPGGALALRFGAAPAPGAAAATAPRPAAAPATTSGGDPALVGTWSRNETLMSGDASMVTQYFLVVNADGTWSTGTGESFASGYGTTARGGGGGGSGGRWRTEGNGVYVDLGGGWEPYARYYVEGGSLMLTYGNGTREVWHRR